MREKARAARKQKPTQQQAEQLLKRINHPDPIEELLQRIKALSGLAELQKGGLVDSLPFKIDAFSLLTGIPKQTIYNKISTQAEGFPRPRYVGKHPVWLFSEIRQYIESRPTEPPRRRKAVQHRE